MRTAVAFFIFNRPEETRKVFEQIRKAQPPKLFIVADGPRSEKERILCEETRKIASAVDWPCEVKKNFSETNLGCGIRLSSGVTWVFEEVEEAIFLEDDCLPHATFFRFCEELLEYYRNNERVMHIAGICAQEGNKKFRPQASYYFSIMPNLWGWASWRRAWNKYDYDMKEWPQKKKAGELIDWFSNPAAYERFSLVFDQYYRHEINNWDEQWVFACTSSRGLCINPTVNLVSNIGFNERGTHFKGDGEIAELSVEPMTFPLRHPPIGVDHAADVYKYRHLWDIDKKLYYRLLRPIKNNFPDLYRKIKQLVGRI